MPLERLAPLAREARASKRRKHVLLPLASLPQLIGWGLHTADDVFGLLPRQTQWVAARASAAGAGVATGLPHGQVDPVVEVAAPEHVVELAEVQALVAHARLVLHLLLGQCSHTVGPGLAFEDAHTDARPGDTHACGGYRQY